MADKVEGIERDRKVPLDDVMIAMDVVDTLRHDKRIVERELNDEKRREDLIARLRELYRGQGIEVPDRILGEGVRALEEERFVYKPPKESFQRRLAQLYVTRNTWGRFVLGAIGGLAILWAAWYVIYEWPRNKEAETQRIEMEERVPRSLQSLVEQISVVTAKPAVLQRAQQLKKDGLDAASSNRLDDAKAAERELSRILGILRQEYQIKIVTRKGELSGLWRVPKLNPNARNYYLIVEAVDGSGRVVPQVIANEETGESERVKVWAIRVPQVVLEKVQEDKRDDGIIQNAIVARKRRGALEPDWLVDVTGGAITEW